MTVGGVLAVALFAFAGNAYAIDSSVLAGNALKAVDRVVTLQNSNGTWDWVVTNATGPTSSAYYNLAGVTGLGLLDAYTQSKDSKYLDAAKKVGDYIVAFNSPSVSDAKAQNADSVNFLRKLGTASGIASYTTTADAILRHVLSEPNYETTHDNNYCTANGCTPAQLYSANSFYYGVANQGAAVWNLEPFVTATWNSGETATSTAFEAEMLNQISLYTPSTQYYSLAVAAGISAANTVGDTTGKATLLGLLTANSDGSFGTETEGKIQTTAYALMALKSVGDSRADAAITYLSSQFGYPDHLVPTYNGWMDTGTTPADYAEYAEVDSEAARALFSVLPIDTHYATLPVDVTKTATVGDVTVTAEMPAGVVITGNSSWDGVVSDPVATTKTVTISGFDTTVTSAIAVGSSDADLTFDKAVKLTFAGQAGKLIGWYNHAGDFSEITAPCSGNNDEPSQTASLGAGASCKMDSASYLVVWTKHFSTFVTYTQTQTPAPTSGRSGGHRSSNSATPAVRAVPGVSPAIPAVPAGRVLGAFTGPEGTNLDSPAIVAIKAQIAGLIAQLISLLREQLATAVAAGLR